MTDLQAKAATMRQHQMTFQEARRIFCEELNQDEGLRLAYRAVIACTLNDRARQGPTYYEAMSNCTTMAERLLEVLFKKP